MPCHTENLRWLPASQSASGGRCGGPIRAFPILSNGSWFLLTATNHEYEQVTRWTLESAAGSGSDQHTNRTYRSTHVRLPRRKRPDTISYYSTVLPHTRLAAGGEWYGNVVCNLLVRSRVRPSYGLNRLVSCALLRPKRPLFATETRGLLPARSCHVTRVVK